jgi:diguanylate cyclase (GGDEF)-like protein
LALLLLDVDGFAQVNHALGYQAGDDLILRRVAELLTAGDAPGRVRGSDIAARFGGEEFALILPETGKAGAIAKANRIRETDGLGRSGAGLGRRRRRGHQRRRRSRR